MRDLELINYIYSAELNLDKETIDTINKLSEVFNLDIIFTVKDTKRDILEKINKLYPKSAWHMDTNMIYFNQKQGNTKRKDEKIWKIL